MVVLVTYDTDLNTREARERLLRIADICGHLGNGHRVQKMVFECKFEPFIWLSLKNALMKEIDPRKDSLCFYFLENDWQKRVEYYGITR